MRLPTTKFHVHTIVVRSQRGYGFPVDMLRYDCCVPASEADANTITRTFNNPEQTPAGTLVTLRKYTGEGVFPRATDGRWQSFGWEVVEESA